ERFGALFHWKDGEVTEVDGIPATEVIDGGLIYGGLLEVSLHPDFEDNGLVYLAYDDPAYELVVARFHLVDDRAEDLEVVWRSPFFSLGSRIAWQDPDHFFVSFGIGGSPHADPGPQDLTADTGKIHRLRADGAVPDDNPVFDGQTEPSSIWSYGHRNPQGLFHEADTGTLWATEHGPKGGDELNAIVRGGNHGWPLVSAGLNYDDTPVSTLTPEEAAAFSVLPAKTWTPRFRVAPAGLLRVGPSPIPAWEGSFLMGSLHQQGLLRHDLATDETEVVGVQVGRVRDVDQLPGGDLVVTIDAGSPSAADEGRVVRLSAR
ncbi:MAG: PQQ-dependent sugar dehydrogenase, partial [Myxococcales bacterium]|nr:PQQ-dependent sugar dehydrogenase [Myxococcales bacterium]